MRTGPSIDQASARECYRKANVDPRRCSSDPNFVLYLRNDPNRPPSAPADERGLTSKKCAVAMRDPNHKFQLIWGSQGWANRHKGWNAACWGNGDWFDWVAEGSGCDQNWGSNLNAPTVFGFADSMAAYCSSRGGNQGDPGSACEGAGLNILRTHSWNMCRNAEWMICVIQGKACWGGGGSGEIIFTLAPNLLELANFEANDNGYSENDIYYLEVGLASNDVRSSAHARLQS